MTKLKGNTMTIRETDPTAPAADDEPVTQSTPDLFVYQTPDPDPAAEIEAEEDDEVQAVFDDDVDPSDETEAVVEVEADDDAHIEMASQVDDVDTYDDETEAEAADVEVEAEAEAEAEDEDEAEVEAAEPEVDDDVDLYDETESDAAIDGQPEHNGDGQAEPDAEDEGPDDPATQLVAIDGDPETLDPQDHAEVLEGPADGATEDRPFLSDGGVFEERWNAIQIGFVDDPREAVQSADHLVTEAIDDLAKILVNQRELLQAQWGDDVDTEQLRVVFRDYRALLLGLLHT
jgi:hypothetical protein